jgi:hypothetical protein
VRYPDSTSSAHHTQSADTLQYARELARQPAVVTSSQRQRHVANGYHNGRLRAGELRESMSGDDRSEQQQHEPTVRVTRHRAVPQVEQQQPVQVSAAATVTLLCMHVHAGT